MKNRSKTEIFAQILEAAVGGTNRNRIKYKAFLSYGQLKEYLDLLIENGLLDYNKVGAIIKTTEKGARFLKILEQGHLMQWTMQ